MANRFNQVDFDQPMSSYVPIPLDTLYKMGAGMQQKYDNNIQDTYKLNDVVASVNAIDQHKGYKKQLDDQYHPQVEAIAEGLKSGKISGQEAQYQIKKLGRDFLNNPLRQELETSYQNYGLYQKDKMSKGDKYAIYKDPTRNFKGTNDQGIEGFRFTGMGEIQDHASEARDQMKDIAKSGYDSKNSYLDPNDGNIYTKDSHGKYIKDKRVDDLASQKVIPFIQTQKGKDYLELIKYQNPNDTNDQIFEKVKSYLKAAGANQIFSDMGGGNDVQVTGLSTMKAADAKEAKQNPSIQPWDMLIGQGIPEKGGLNKTLEQMSSNFTFDDKGNLIEKTQFNNGFSSKIPYTGINPRTGETFETTKNTYSDKPTQEYIKQQAEVLSFLHNSGLYDTSKNAQDNYKDGIKTYGDAIKSGKLNSMNVPMFDATTSKAMEDYFIPKSNKDGELTSTGLINNWTINGIDKGDSKGKDKFNSIVTNARIIGPDLSSGKGGNIWIESTNGEKYSVNTGSKTLEDNFGKLADFTKTNNEAIFKPNKINQINTLKELIKPKDGMLDKIGNITLNNLMTGDPKIDSQLGQQLEDDRKIIDYHMNELSNNGYKPLTIYHDKQSNTMGISFINNSDPQSPNIQVIEYQPGAEPTIVSDAVFNRDMYQKLFGTYAANKSEKSSSFKQTNLSTQKAK